MRMFLIFCVLALGACGSFQGIRFSTPTYQGCSTEYRGAAILDCWSGRNNAWASQHQRAYELQIEHGYAVFDAARSSVSIDPHTGVAITSMDCSKSAYKDKCYEGLVEGERDALWAWQNALQTAGENVRTRECLKAGGVPGWC